MKTNTNDSGKRMTTSSSFSSREVGAPSLEVSKARLVGDLSTNLVGVTQPTAEVGTG